MPIVPISQTGSAARYPLASSKQFHGASIRFLDGDEQRFIARKNATLQWHLNVGRLSASESVRWLQFADSAIRSQSGFTYLDPVTGASHSNCQIADAAVLMERSGEDSSEITLTVRSEGD